MKVFVLTRTLRQEDHPDVTIHDDPELLVPELRSQPGKDVWLFGGGSLFRSFAQRGLVDTVEVAVIPILLGDGIPLLPPPSTRISLALSGHTVYAKTGTVTLEYVVQDRRRKTLRRT